MVYVDENETTKARKTTIAIAAGKITKVYWVTQPIKPICGLNPGIVREFVLR